MTLLKPLLLAGALLGAPAAAQAPANLHWVHSQNGAPIPDGAFVGGQENGGPLVVCRADWHGNLYPGKLVKGNCNIAVGGIEQPVNSYDVLVGTGGQWQPASGGLTGGFVAGFEADKPLLLCQAPYRRGLHPGKIVNGRCNISYGGREIPVTPFDVFIAGAPSAVADYRYADAPAFFYALPVYDPRAAAVNRQRQADLDAQQRALDAERAQMNAQQRAQAQRDADLRAQQAQQAQRDAAQRQRDADLRAQQAQQAQQQQQLEQQRAALAAQQKADAEAAAARQRAEGEAEENRMALQAQAQAEAEAKAQADAEAQKQAQIRQGEEEENRMAAEAQAQAEAEAQKQEQIRQGEEEENRMAAEAEKQAEESKDTPDDPPPQ